MKFEENKTVKSYLVRYSLSSLLRFLGGFGGLLIFFSIFFLLPLLKRGTPTVAEHTGLESITLISRKSQSPKILLRQGKVGTQFYHSLTVEAKEKIPTRSLSRENINVSLFWMHSSQSGNTLQSPGPSAPTAIVLDRKKGLKDHFQSIWMDDVFRLC